MSVSEGLTLEFSTETAQLDTLNYIENPLTETVYMNAGDTLMAGIDFPAGVYDISSKDEEVWLTYRIPANPEWYEEGFNEYFLWLDQDMNAGSYANVVLPEGAEVIAEDADAVLTPSEIIGDTDYSTYYDYYVYE